MRDVPHRQDLPSKWSSPSSSLSCWWACSQTHLALIVAASVLRRWCPRLPRRDMTRRPARARPWCPAHAPWPAIAPSSVRAAAILNSTAIGRIRGVNAYPKVTREDSDAIYAYLRSIPPVKQRNREHDLKFPFNNRSLILGWRTLFFKEGEFKSDPTKSADWNWSSRQGPLLFVVHHLEELVGRPHADPGLWIGRYVRGIERAERRLHQKRTHPSPCLVA